MKKVLLAAALAAATAIAAAQEPTTSVTLTKVLDIQVDVNNSEAMGSSTYDPAADKFIVGTRGTGARLQVYNSATGAYETDMSKAGITPGGLGFFGVTAAQNGYVYAYEDGGKDIWRWGSISDSAPQKVYDTAAFARTGYTGTVGNDIVIAFTGSANKGPVEFFSDSIPFSSSSFTFNESATLEAKPTVAINNAGTVAFTTGDTGLNLVKWTKVDGVWNMGWSVPFGGGPIAYDNTHDVVIGVGRNTNKITVFRGSNGNIDGQLATTNAMNATPQCEGGFAVPNATGGRVYLSGPGSVVSPAGKAVFLVYDYVIPNAAVNDWSLYKQ